MIYGFETGSNDFSAKLQKNAYAITHSKLPVIPKFELEAAFFFDYRLLWSSLPDDPIKMNMIYALFDFQRELKQELSKTYYLGPFRQSPQRKYATRGSNPTEVGPMGESTVTLLANEAVQTSSRKHIHQIAKWMSMMGLAKSLDVSRIGRSDLFEVSLTLTDDERLPLADLGYGLSQVLPVLTQCSFAGEGSTLLFEQPKLHLHSIAARKLAQVFIQTAASKGAHILIETHSPELIKEFLREVEGDNLQLSDLAVYRVARENKESIIKPIQMELESREVDIYENWEKGNSIP